MDCNENSEAPSRRERIFPVLNLNLEEQSTLNTIQQPVLVVQSPKTPTLSRKLKAVSLDSDPQQNNTLEVSRDVFSMPNTPKRHIKQKLSCDLDETTQKTTLTPSFSSNLKKFASNNSISGSQTLKTLPEIMTLQDFSDCPIPEPVRFRAKGLLERRGSNASLTIDLGSNSSIAEGKPVPLNRLNTAKSVSNLYLSSLATSEKCMCIKKCETTEKEVVTSSSNTSKISERRKSQEACGNCTIYESVPSKINNNCNPKCQPVKRCSCCTKSRRKSLSNENLYIPPCGFCQTGESKEGPESLRHCKGYRKACYPRQQDFDPSQLLSDDFKLHLQNIQYLQTAGSILTVKDLKQSCEVSRVPKLHQEFWEIPLNLQEKCYVSGSQSKNRYRGVLPNEHSRVHLSGTQGYIHANFIKGPDYTETCYIATQGPMSHTCTDFWEMVWQTHCKCIVMLTGLVEKGRSKCELYFPLGKDPHIKDSTFFYVKTTKVRDKFTFDSKNVNEYDEEVHKFEELNEVSFGKYQIKFIGRQNIDNCQIRQLELHKIDTAEYRVVHHYWLSEWPDHKMANPEQVLKIALDVLKFVELDNNASDISKSNHDEKVVPSAVESRTSTSKSHYGRSELNRRGYFETIERETPFKFNKTRSYKREFSAKTFFEEKVATQERKRSTDNIKLPIVVHCSAGIGRTGCFLAILNGIQQLKTNLTVDVLAVLCSLRLNRGGMVQTAEQYELIHRVLSLFAEQL